MKFRQVYFMESVKLPDIWYHGSKVDFGKFDINYAITKESIAQEGPGFYLTTDKNDAERYGIINKEQSGFLKEIKLVRKSGIRKESAKFRDEFAGSLMRRMPDKEDKLTNWDENPTRAFNMLRQSILDSSENLKEMILNVWADCYMGDEQLLMKYLVRGGIDGLLIEKKNDVKWLVVYNPDILKIVNTVKL